MGNASAMGGGHISRFDPALRSDPFGMLPSKQEKAWLKAVSESKYDGETTGFERINAIIAEDPSIVRGDLGNGFNCLHIILGAFFSIDESDPEDDQEEGQEEEEGLSKGKKKKKKPVAKKTKKKSTATGLQQPRQGPGAPTSVELVSHLIELGADLRAANSTGYTPLGWAINGGSTPDAIIDLLVREGSDPDAEANNGVAAVHSLKKKRQAELRALYARYTEHGPELQRSYGPIHVRQQMAKRTLSDYDAYRIMLAEANREHFLRVQRFKSEGHHGFLQLSEDDKFQVMKSSALIRDLMSDGSDEEPWKPSPKPEPVPANPLDLLFAAALGRE